MKNNISKFYIVAIYLCSTFVMFAADPGANNAGGTLEGDGDNTGASPIGDYIWVLAVIVIGYAFWKIRAFSLAENGSK
jgi:hypothetical protein